MITRECDYSEKDYTANSNSHSEPEAGTMAVNECDTKCDTNANFVILEFTQRAANVYAYIKDIAPIADVPIRSPDRRICWWPTRAYTMRTTHTTRQEMVNSRLS